MLALLPSLSPLLPQDLHGHVAAAVIRGGLHHPRRRAKAPASRLHLADRRRRHSFGHDAGRAPPLSPIARCCRRCCPRLLAAIAWLAVPFSGRPAGCWRLFAWVTSLRRCRDGDCTLCAASTLCMCVRRVVNYVSVYRDARAITLPRQPTSDTFMFS